MPDTQTVVVLGGGIGGVVAARRLRALAPPQARVVLVEKSLRQSYPPSYTWVMTGERRPDAITRDLARLRRKGIEVVEAAVDAIDADARTVSAGGAEITFDHLVVALGADLAPEAVPGLAGQAFTYYQAAEAERLHHALDGFTGGRVALVIPSL
ncbi:MAG: FAD-dependent oxidoreductase, partial [Dehalococcoidia bacterium]